MTNPVKTIPALPGPYSIEAVANRLIAVAGSQEGYREGRSGGSWDNDTAFGEWYGLNGNAWCAMFVSWCANRAGIPETVVPKHAYTPTGYNWFKSRGQTVASPKRGDIMYVYSSSAGRIAHVGIVESVSGGYVHTIEGNTNTSGSAQGDGVYRLRRPINSRLKFARPNYSACVKTEPNRPVLEGSVLAAQTLNDLADRQGRDHTYRLRAEQLVMVARAKRSIQILCARKGEVINPRWSALAHVQVFQRLYQGVPAGKNTGIAYTFTARLLAKLAGYTYKD